MAVNNIKYYKFLIQNFGNIQYVGCKALAYILANYNDQDLKDLYKEYAQKIGSTPVAVERSVRTYLKVIEEDYTLEDFSKFLNYSFKPGQTKLTIKEFVILFKMYIDELDENQPLEQ